MTDQLAEFPEKNFRCFGCNKELENFSDEEVSTRWTMPWTAIAPSPVPTEDYLLLCNDCTNAMKQANDSNRRLAGRRPR
jgi:hypothetical protein